VPPAAPDPPAGVLVDPDGQELREPGAVLLENAEGAVPGADQACRGLDDAPQHIGQAQVAGDPDDRVEQPPDLAGEQVGQRCGPHGCSFRTFGAVLLISGIADSSMAPTGDGSWRSRRGG